jgi:hypothetical protein
MSWRASCWTRAPIPMPPPRAGHTCTRLRSRRVRQSVQSRPGQKACRAWCKCKRADDKVRQRRAESLNMIGATPFLMAAGTADAPLMRLLAELGADPLLPNADNIIACSNVIGRGCTPQSSCSRGTHVSKGSTKSSRPIAALIDISHTDAALTTGRAVLPRRNFEARTPSRGFFSIHQIRT